MKIALDPFMHHHLSLDDLSRKVKLLGFGWIPRRYHPHGEFETGEISPL